MGIGQMQDDGESERSSTQSMVADLFHFCFRQKSWPERCHGQSAKR
jgi:hypothetical protein